MPKVTMVLTDRDVENTGRIHDFTDAKSRAHAISIALSMTAFLADQMASGAELMLRNSDGSLSRVKMAELPPAPSIT